MRTEKVLRAGLAAMAGVVVVLLGAGAASAHVSIAEAEHEADTYTLMTFGVPHGCDTSPTTQVRIQIPEPIAQVTPTVNPGWDVEKVMETLDAPMEGAHGVQLTERVAEVVYTAKAPLPADLRDAFVLSLRTPDLPGETLYFPTVQICAEGETAWVEVPTDAVPAEELEAPSPQVLLLAADSGGAVEAETIAAGGGESAQAPAADDGDGGSDALSIVALVVGLVAVVLAGASLALRRR